MHRHRERQRRDPDSAFAAIPTACRIRDFADLILSRLRSRRVEGCSRRRVSALWSVVRGRFAAPHDEGTLAASDSKQTSRAVRLDRDAFVQPGQVIDGCSGTWLTLRRKPCRRIAVNRLRRSCAALRSLRDDCDAPAWRSLAMDFDGSVRPIGAGARRRSPRQEKARLAGKGSRPRSDRASGLDRAPGRGVAAAV